MAYVLIRKFAYVLLGTVACFTWMYVFMSIIKILFLN